MKIFITGGDGLLGSNLIRELLKKDHEIKVLVRKGRQTITLDGLNVERIKGDLLDYQSLSAAAKGAEVIYHVAASTSIWPSRSKMVNKVNIEGTQNIIKLAKSINIKKLIYVGTANSFSFGTKENPGKEGTPYLAGKYGLDYMDSKYKAHQLINEAVKDGLPAVVVNPTFMLGAFDSMPSSGAMVLAVYEQKIPGYAPGGRNYICVKDAAVGIANALEKGRVGESYIIGNKNMSYKEAFGMMANVLGVNAPKLGMPKLAVLGFGFISNLIFKITGKKPTVSYPMAKIACDTHYFTAQKAVDELGLPQSPIEEGIQECFDWLNENGYVKS